MTVLRINSDLRLIPLEDHHAEELFRLVDNNRRYLREFLPWVDFNRSAEDSLEFLSLTRDTEAAGTAFIRLIEFQGQLAGVAGFRSLDAANRQGEIGYWLAEPLQGRGLVTRCVETLIEYGFAILDLHRIQLRAAVNNAKSRAIPERLGFTEEGVTRSAEWLYDHFVDLAVYSLLRQEWRDAT